MQVDAEIEVAWENKKEQDSKETQVSKWPSADKETISNTCFSFFLGALSSSYILLITASFRFDVSSESIFQSKCKEFCEKV